MGSIVAYCERQSKRTTEIVVRARYPQNWLFRR